MPILRYVYAALIFGGLVALYISGYLLNKRVKKPEGCEDIGCSSCSIKTCSLNTNKEEE